MRLVRKLLLAIATVAGLTLALMLINVLRLPALSAGADTQEKIALNENALAQNLAAAIRIPTVSDPTFYDKANFDAFHQLLLASFPKVFQNLTAERFGDSLLLTWQGRDPSLPGALLAAHMDVVPATTQSNEQWQHPAFSGAISDGYIWGRGTLDDKSSLVAWMESITRLIDQGFQPQQTLYFAFGHDEEIGGLKGAAVMAKALAKRDVELSFVLDEGGIISEGVVAGVERPVATLMTAEKGFASYRLNVTDAGGHSSMPPPLTAVGRIARAVARLDQQPMPARLTNPVTDMLDQLAPAMPFPQRLAIANRWLLETALLKALARTPATNAMTRTTTAATMLSGGVKDNVLPNAAEAVVNFRLLPGDSLETLENHIRNSIADSAVQITQVGDWANVASKVSSSNSVTFAVLQQSVIAVFPKAITVPGLVVGATDARHYADISKDRYNFLPIRLSAEDIERIHGIDERISVQGYADMVRFYIQFLQNLNHIR